MDMGSGVKNLRVFCGPHKLTTPNYLMLLLAKFSSGLHSSKIVNLGECKTEESIHHRMSFIRIEIRVKFSCNKHFQSQDILN